MIEPPVVPSHNAVLQTQQRGRTDAEKMAEDLLRWCDHSPSEALKLACSTIIYLMQHTSGGFLRMQDQSIRPLKAPPPEPLQ